jgi:hypothetical protein
MHPELGSTEHWNITGVLCCEALTPHVWSQEGYVIRRAMPGKVRVVGEDRRYPGTDYPVGEYENRELAIECARTHICEHKTFFVYDDQGALVWKPEGIQPLR